MDVALRVLWIAGGDATVVLYCDDGVCVRLTDVPRTALARLPPGRDVQWACTEAAPEWAWTAAAPGSRLLRGTRHAYVGRAAGRDAPLQPFLVTSDPVCAAGLCGLALFAELRVCGLPRVPAAGEVLRLDWSDARVSVHAPRADEHWCLAALARAGPRGGVRVEYARCADGAAAAVDVAAADAPRCADDALREAVAWGLVLGVPPPALVGRRIAGALRIYVATQLLLRGAPDAPVSAAWGGDDDGATAARYGGGLTLEPQRGVHHGAIYELDVRAMYPSIVCRDGVDWPEFAAARAGLLGAMTRRLVDARFAAERAGHAAHARACKLAANALIGMLGQRRACFGNVECAARVTALGQEALRRARAMADAAGFAVLYGHTDSVYVRVDDAVADPDAAADALCAAFGAATRLELRRKTRLAHMLLYATNNFAGIEHGSGALRVHGSALRHGHQCAFARRVVDDALRRAMLGEVATEADAVAFLARVCVPADVDPAELAPPAAAAAAPTSAVLVADPLADRAAFVAKQLVPFVRRALAHLLAAHDAPAAHDVIAAAADAPTRRERVYAARAPAGPRAAYGASPLTTALRAPVAFDGDADTVPDLSEAALLAALGAGAGACALDLA